MLSEGDKRANTNIGELCQVEKRKHYCDAADPEDSSRDTLRHLVTGDPHVTNIQTQTLHSAKKPKGFTSGRRRYPVCSESLSVTHMSQTFRQKPVSV